MVFQDAEVGKIFYWGGRPLLKIEELTCTENTWRGKRNAIIMDGTGKATYFFPNEPVKDKL